MSQHRRGYQGILIALNDCLYSFCRVLCQLQKLVFFLAAVKLHLRLTGECIEQREEEYLPIQKTLEKHPHLAVIHHRQLLQAISAEFLIRLMHAFLLPSVFMQIVSLNETLLPT